jgi:hypothetical protein
MIVFRLLLMVVLTLVVSSPPAASPESLQTWLEGVLHWTEERAKAYFRVAGTKGMEERHAGERLTRADLATKTESVIYECGSCWSPVVVDDGRVAILKTDGVWLVRLDGGAAHLAVAATRLHKIVGRTKDRPARLLVVQQVAEQAGCEYELRFADVGAGKIEEAEGIAVTCVGEEDLAALRKPDMFHNGRVVRATDPAGRFPPKLLVADMPAQGERLLPARDLLPWIEDDNGRLDPVWIGDNAVLYVIRGRK